jgi:precorrin-2 dehydrogenase/sirohydrochlorin ferrochelatase
MTDGYPILLRLAGRRCVVVGGGSVAARKVRALIEAGADVVVVAPEIRAELQAMAEQGRLRLRERPFQGADVDGAFLAFAATDQPEVNGAVADAARQRGVPVYIVDDPAACDFTVPATVQRGDVTLAISTGGRSPAFARYLREEMERWLSPERCALLDLAADVRQEIRANGTQADADAWQRALDDTAVRDALAAGDRDAARARMLVVLRSER